METDFLKYFIKKSVWWGNGNYKVFDHERVELFYTKSRLLEFKKKIRMLATDSGEADILIAAENSWMNKFVISRNHIPIVFLTKKSLLQDSSLKVQSDEMGELLIKANVWRTNFTFYNASEEIGRLSFKTWSPGIAGLVIKSGYNPQEIIAITIAVAYLKETGKI